MSYSLARFVPETAPGGLALVQGVLNTRATASGSPDLLDGLGTANAWLADVLAEWGERDGGTPPRVRLSTAGLLRLRDVRDAVRAVVAGDGGSASADVRLEIASDAAGVRARPTAAGVEWLEAALWLAVLEGGLQGTLGRLKLCRNEACGAAFYDRSKNASRVWHDVRTCGNTANLRASRARRRAGR